MAERKPEPLVGRLVVVGLGLIGGSFAKGLRQLGLCREVVGVDLDAESRRLAVQLGVVDRCESELAAACVGAEVIMLAVPILAMEKVLAQLAALDLGDAVLTDAGSAKRAALVASGASPTTTTAATPPTGSTRTERTVPASRTLTVKPPRSAAATLSG